MANIDFFIYAESAANVNVPTIDNPNPGEQKLQITTPTALFRPLFVPCLFSYSVAVSITHFDVLSHHTVRMTVHYYDEAEVLADTGILPIAPFNEQLFTNLPADLRGITFSLDFRNIPLRQNGKYKTIFYWNGENIGEYPFHVWGKEGLERD